MSAPVRATVYVHVRDDAPIARRRDGLGTGSTRVEFDGDAVDLVLFLTPSAAERLRAILPAEPIS